MATDIALERQARSYAHWDEVAADVGQEVAVSSWLTVTQDMINRFADATGDHFWIHVDVERARRESPHGCTIAHGLLSLSLLPQLRVDCLTFPPAREALNYGFDRVRFTAALPVDSRVRGRFSITALQAARGGHLARLGVVLEREGHDKPVLVTDWSNWRSAD